MNTVTISKNRVKREGGVVVLSVEKYEKLLARAVPAYYLTGKEAEKADALVNEGILEYQSGKTVKAPSLKSALRVWQR